MHSVYRTWKRSRRPQAVWLLLFCAYPLSTSADEFPAVDCIISPYQIVDLASAVPGVIERILVERSDFVTRGQVVAELAAGVERATVALARARAQVEPEINVWQVNLEFDERRKARIHSLYANKVVSDDNKDEADREAELSSWKLQQAHDLKKIRKLELERAEEQLKQKIIKSPIDGFILEKFKLPGEYVEDQPILRIAQLDPLNVEAIVPIELFGKIPVGMAAEVHPETLTAETRPARVTVVDRMGDAGSGTFGVRLEMPNPGYELPAGLKCDLRFIPGSVTAITTPPPQHKASSPRDQAPQPDLVPIGSEPDIPQDQARDRLPDAYGEPEPVMQGSADQLIAAMPREPGAGAQREPADTSELLIATAAAPTVGPKVDNTDVGGVDAPNSGNEFHPIRLYRTSAEQEDNPSTDSGFELSPAEIGEDIAIAIIDQAYRIGPIRSKSELNRITELLREQDVSYQVRSEAIEETMDYIVVSPVFSTVEAARTRVDGMRQHGISDVMQVRVGDYKDRVSAGVYAKHGSAMRRKIRLSELGYETEVFARTKMVDFWWVDLQYSSNENDKLSEFQGRLGQHISMVAMGTQNRQ